MSKLEELLNAAAAGETTDLKPQSRMEAYLKACVNGDGADNLPSPQSRADALLIKLAGKMAGGSSGGGGGIIECDRLPTSNVEEGKIYHARWTETVDTSTYTAYMDYGDGDLPVDMSDFIYGVVDTIDDFTADMSPHDPYLCKQDGKLYMFIDGVVADFVEFNGISDQVVQLGLVDESFVFNPSEYSVPCAIYTVYRQGEIKQVERQKYGFAPSSPDELVRYDGFEWASTNAIKVLLDRSPKAFSYANTVEDLKGVIHYSDTSGVTDMSYMFTDCHMLRRVPLFDTSDVTDMSNMFSDCNNLIEVPLFDTRKVGDMSWMFDTCRSLITVPAFDIRNVIDADYMFRTCTGLTECWLRNIKTTLQVGSGTSYGHLLTVDSLVHLIYELRDTGSTKTLTVGTANLEKLANVYVKSVVITDEMRAKDDLVDEKLPFVVCESTDEGATLIVDYAKFKNWNIA